MRLSHNLFIFVLIFSVFILSFSFFPYAKEGTCFYLKQKNIFSKCFEKRVEEQINVPFNNVCIVKCILGHEYFLILWNVIFLSFGSSWVLMLTSLSYGTSQM